jgi:hypothetical protein
VSDREHDADPDPKGGYVIGPGEGEPDVVLSPSSREARASRSDEWILAQIRERLGASSLADSHIDVQVTHADVVLRGHVTGPGAKHLVEQIAESVAGIRTVRSELTVPSDQPDVPDERRRRAS